MLADIKGPHLDFFWGANSLSHGSGLETTIFGSSGSSPKPDKIVGEIESGSTEVYCDFSVMKA